MKQHLFLKELAPAPTMIFFTTAWMKLFFLLFYTIKDVKVP